MIDINLIRNNIDIIKESLQNRGIDSTIAEEVLQLDTERRKYLVEVEQLRQERNVKSAAVKNASSEERESIIKEVINIKTEITALNSRLEEIEEARNRLMSSIPNIPDASVPIGHTEEENKVYKVGLEKRTFDFKPLPHWEIKTCKKQIEFERGVKLSGSRFYVLRSGLARLQRGLIAYLLNSHREEGYEELYLPHIVRKANLYNSGQLPKFASNIYRDHEEDYWLIPTAEVPITSFHSEEYLTTEQLPLSYCSYTPCFRREKMSAGKDVRGIKRGHQFDKVELYKFTDPEDSETALQEMMAYTEKICIDLELPYRILQLCTGDLGFSSAVTYDIETWAPGSEEWLEISSVSNCTDFQSRRANIKTKKGKKSKLVHTLNGSAFGIPRTMITIMENNQQEDGSIKVPKALRSYVGEDYITP
ncbi:MAG: serine--tRNA ligase [Chitinophagales bacterium]|nr:serine--tRNA ligase [Chitinophagales bacterium]